MTMAFRITGLSAEPFQSLYGLSDAELATHGVKRYAVDQSPGFPDRIEMRDGRVGETMLLLNHLCQPANTPYRATHAIFVREGAKATFDAVDTVPEVMCRRILSLRAFDTIGMMLNTDITEGRDVEALIERLFANPAVSYIHARNAKQG